MLKGTLFIITKRTLFNLYSVQRKTWVLHHMNHKQIEKQYLHVYKIHSFRTLAVILVSDFLCHSSHSLSLSLVLFWCVFVCVCVCVRLRERERERERVSE